MGVSIEVSQVNKDDLKTLGQKDIYSLVLFALYNLKDIPEYSTLSELSYVLDKENLMRLLDYFGGTTIKIPTKRELQVVINALLIYQSVKVEKTSLALALSKLTDIDRVQLREIKLLYNQLCEIMDKYYINE
jgi:hypothetical protein